MENHNGLSIGDLASTDLALVSASCEYRAQLSGTLHGRRVAERRPAVLDLAMIHVVVVVDDFLALRCATRLGRPRNALSRES